MRPPHRTRRSFRPALEPCESREMLSVAAAAEPAAMSAAPAVVARQQAARNLIEPLRFGTTIQAGPLAGTTLYGTLRLRTDGHGALAGTLADSARGTIHVRGVAGAERIALAFDLGPNGTLRAEGLLLRGRIGTGRLTFTARGEVTATRGGPGLGIFGIDGSAAAFVVPKTLGNAPAVHAGTVFAPTGFSATFRRGPDAGMRLAGILILGPVGPGGRFVGRLADITRGVVPVTGRVTGGQILLRFNLGSQGTVEGIGPFQVRTEPGGTVTAFAIGSLSGLRTGNSGDWGVSPLSHSDQSNRNLAGFYAPAGTIFVGTNFSRSNLTGAHLTGVVLLNVNLNDANLSGADLRDATYSGSTALRADLSNTLSSRVNMRSQLDISGATVAGSTILSSDRSVVIVWAPLAAASPPNAIFFYFDSAGNVVYLPHLVDFGD